MEVNFGDAVSKFKTFLLEMYYIYTSGFHLDEILHSNDQKLQTGF